MPDKSTVATVARELDRSWNSVNDNIAVEATTAVLLIAGPIRLDGVEVIGVELVWVDEHQ